MIEKLFILIDNKLKSINLDFRTNQQKLSFVDYK